MYHQYHVVSLEKECYECNIRGKGYERLFMSVIINQGNQNILIMI